MEDACDGVEKRLVGRAPGSTQTQTGQFHPRRHVTCNRGTIITCTVNGAWKARLNPPLHQSNRHMYRKSTVSINITGWYLRQVRDLSEAQNPKKATNLDDLIGYSLSGKRGNGPKVKRKWWVLQTHTKNLLRVWLDIRLRVHYETIRLLCRLL